jgi:hypothetical protein
MASGDEFPATSGDNSPATFWRRSGDEAGAPPPEFPEIVRKLGVGAGGLAPGVVAGVVAGAAGGVAGGCWSRRWKLPEVAGAVAGAGAGVLEADGAGAGGADAGGGAGTPELEASPEFRRWLLRRCVVPLVVEGGDPIQPHAPIHRRGPREKDSHSY